MGSFDQNFPGTWGYENFMITHFWLDDSAADLLANPEKWCVKMEINNPSGTPLARYIRLGAAESEGAGKFSSDLGPCKFGRRCHTQHDDNGRPCSSKLTTDLFPPLEEATEPAFE